MLNPDDMVAAWCAKLSSIADLVAVLGDSGAILPYQDRFPDQSNLRVAILQAEPGSILVVWQGSGPGKLNGYIVWKHRFSLYVRAPESDGTGSYAKLFWLIVNGVPSGGSLPLLHAPIHDACYPMDLELPTAQRNTLVVSADGATIDYFEIQVSLTEIGDN
jgi:hypothetical protein